LTDISYWGNNRIGGQESELQRCFARVGAEHGFTDVNANWERFKEFKATWKR